MRGFLYRLFTGLARYAGPWILIFFVWFVTTGFFFLFPRRVAVGVRFYGALFPDRSWLYHLYCVWGQYHSYSRLFIDRFLLRQGDVTCTSEGWEYLADAADKGTGGILLMSHLGNWEVAAYLLKHKGTKILLYMGIDHREQIERIQKRDLAKADLRIVTLDENGISPLAIVEGINYLKEGGLVAMTGDLVFSGEQRVSRVPFLGREAAIPETPHIFALLSGAPIFTFFVHRLGHMTYHIEVFPPFHVKAANRAGREEALRRSILHYAALLEGQVKKHPLEWYHFKAFLGRKLD